jgi:hypothetical protein
MSASRLLALLVALAVARLHAAPPAGVDEKFAPVNGTVTLDGKPLAEARVLFHQGDQFVGAKIRGGKYRVRWVPVGGHKVTVELLKEGKSVLPPKFSEEDKAVLRVEVKEGVNVLDFSLTSK